MKRILFISLSNLLLLTACGTSASKNIPSDTQISNSIDSTISTNIICQIKWDKTFHLRNSKKLLMVFGNLVIF